MRENSRLAAIVMALVEKGEENVSVSVGTKDLKEFLGPPKSTTSAFRKKVKPEQPLTAWTETGVTSL